MTLTEMVALVIQKSICPDEISDPEDPISAEKKLEYTDAARKVIKIVRSYDAGRGR
jgi:hypothetical protein